MGCRSGLSPFHVKPSFSSSSSLCLLVLEGGLEKWALFFLHETIIFRIIISLFIDFGRWVGGMVCLLLLRNHHHLLGLSFLLGGFWEKMSVIGVYFDPSVVVVCGKRKLRSWFWRVRAGIRRQIRSSRSKQRFSFNYDPFSYALNFDNGNFGFFC